MSYGRHQSFIFKRHWTAKTFSSIKENPNVIIDSEGYKQLGIGKNMQQALRFWLEASNLFDFSNKQNCLTRFGEIISKYDSGCYFPISKNIVHFFLTTKFNEKSFKGSSAFFWFYNEYSDKVFTKESLKNELIKYDKGTSSKITLGKEIDILLLSYIRSKPIHPEDKNISLLSDLGLISIEGNSTYSKTKISKEMMSIQAFIFMILFLGSIGEFLSIENMARGNNGLGKLFNLQRFELIDMIEQIKKEYPGIDIIRTNNIDIVKILHQTDPFEYLESAYRRISNDN